MSKVEIALLAVIVILAIAVSFLLWPGNPLARTLVPPTPTYTPLPTPTPRPTNTPRPLPTPTLDLTQLQLENFLGQFDIILADAWQTWGDIDSQLESVQTGGGRLSCAQETLLILEEAANKINELHTRVLNTRPPASARVLKTTFAEALFTQMDGYQDFINACIDRRQELMSRGISKMSRARQLWSETDELRAQWR